MARMRGTSAGRSDHCAAVSEVLTFALKQAIERIAAEVPSDLRADGRQSVNAAVSVLSHTATDSTRAIESA